MFDIISISPEYIDVNGYLVRGDIEKGDFLIIQEVKEMNDFMTIAIWQREELQRMTKEIAENRKEIRALQNAAGAMGMALVIVAAALIHFL